MMPKRQRVCESCKNRPIRVYNKSGLCDSCANRIRAKNKVNKLKVKEENKSLILRERYFCEYCKEGFRCYINLRKHKCLKKELAKRFG